MAMTMNGVYQLPVSRETVWAKLNDRPRCAVQRRETTKHHVARGGAPSALLARSFTPPQDAALFAEMLSLPNDGRYPATEFVPQQRRRRTMEALNAQVEALAQQALVLMIFEDVHWIDPTSLGALGRGIAVRSATCAARVHPRCVPGSCYGRASRRRKSAAPRQSD
jgi:hypothetical protein